MCIRKMKAAEDTEDAEERISVHFSPRPQRPPRMNFVHRLY